MTRILASLLVLGLVLVSPAFAADSTKTAKGKVKTVAADSLTVTDSAGKDWTFAVDTKTKVIATGGSHKTAETKAAGKTPEITDVVKRRCFGHRQVSRDGRGQDARGQGPRDVTASRFWDHRAHADGGLAVVRRSDLPRAITRLPRPPPGDALVAAQRLGARLRHGGDVDRHASFRVRAGGRRSTWPSIWLVSLVVALAGRTRRRSARARTGCGSA